jgi:hypothetical protein
VSYYRAARIQRNHYEAIDSRQGGMTMSNSPSQPPANKPPPDIKRSPIGIGLGVGVAVGVAIGVAINNLIVGIVIGIILGMAFGAVIGRQRARKQ